MATFSQRLNKSVVFETQSTTRDSFGQPAATWSTAVTAFAEITPLTGRELIAAQAAQSEVTHRVTVRYVAALANPKMVAAMRIKYGTRYFNIKSVTNMNEANRVIVLMCTEGPNNG